MCHEAPLFVEIATKQSLPNFQPSGGGRLALFKKASLTKNKFPSANRISDGRCPVPSGGNREAALALQVAPKFVEVFSGDQPFPLAFFPPMDSKFPLSSSGMITECRPPVRPFICCQ